MAKSIHRAVGAQGSRRQGTHPRNDNISSVIEVVKRTEDFGKTSVLGPEQQGNQLGALLWVKREKRSDALLDSLRSGGIE